MCIRSCNSEYIRRWIVTHFTQLANYTSLFHDLWQIYSKIADGQNDTPCYGKLSKTYMVRYAIAPRKSGLHQHAEVPQQLHTGHIWAYLHGMHPGASGMPERGARHGAARAINETKPSETKQNLNNFTIKPLKID